MTNRSTPRRKRPAVVLASGHRWRVYSLTMEEGEEAVFLLGLFEASVTLRKAAQIDYLDEKAWDLASSIRENALWRIINMINLAGLEYRNGLGEFIATITGIAEPISSTIPSLDTWIYHTEGTTSLDEFFNNLNKRFHYVCLPGCDNYGDYAMAEAFWAKLGEWGVFPERKTCVPPIAIFEEPDT